MNTSILFIELIIIGFQTLIWIILLVFMQLDNALTSKIISNIGAQMIVIIVIFTSYSLGVFTDRLADFIFSKWNQKLKDKVIPNPVPNIGTMRYIVGKDNESLNRFLDYTRSRMRIARATSINLPLITICCLIFGVVKNYFNCWSGIFITIAIIGFLFTGFSIFSWRNITVRHLDLIKTMFANERKEG